MNNDTGASTSTSSSSSIKRKKNIAPTSIDEITTTTTSSSKLPIQVTLDDVKIGTYSDLLKDYAYLSLCETNRTPIKLEDEKMSSVTTTSSSSSSSKKRKEMKQQQQGEETNGISGLDQSLALQQQRNELHIQQCKTNPVDLEIYEEMKKSLKQPTFVNPECPDDTTSQEQIIERFHNRSAHLYIIESDFADLLLQESGTWPASENPKDKLRLRNFPPCMNGTNCFVNSGRMKTEAENVTAFVCTQLMFPEEYKLFLSKGDIKLDQRPCIICCRYEICEEVPHLRAKKRLISQGESSTKGGGGGDTIPWPELKSDTKKTMLQKFREKKDQIGGYLGACMMEPLPGIWEHFIDPITKVILTRMMIKKNKATGRRYIDQNLLKYHPEEREIPHTGESMSHFYRGVDKSQTMLRGLPVQH